MNHRLLQENLQRIQAEISTSAAKAGRSPEQIQLVAVTKYVDVATTLALVEAGQYVLGESRPQQLWEKATALGSKSVQWHMIGHLQRNKANRTLPFCTLIHSVDSLRLAGSINKAASNAGITGRFLLEINISGEDAKHGLKEDEIAKTLESCSELQNIHVSGFMGMASLSGNLDDNRREFARLRGLMSKFEGYQSANVQLNELSMGMSRDFSVAIEEGATIVRVGSSLFEGIEH